MVTSCFTWKLGFDFGRRRFTSLVDWIGTLPYSERLEALNLTTLAERSLRGDLIETFEIFNNLVNYGKNILNRDRFRRNIVSKPCRM